MIRQAQSFSGFALTPAGCQRSIAPIARFLA
jgi:hypothetical protein